MMENGLKEKKHWESFGFRKQVEKWMFRSGSEWERVRQDERETENAERERWDRKDVGTDKRAIVSVGLLAIYLKGSESGRERESVEIFLCNFLSVGVVSIVDIYFQVHALATNSKMLFKFDGKRSSQSFLLHF